MRIAEEKLKSLLLSSDILDEADYQAAKDESVMSGQNILDVLMGQRIITENYLAEILQPYFGVKIVDLKDETIAFETLEMLPETFAKARNAIIFEFDAKKKIAKLAMVDPLDYDTIEFVRAKFDCWVEVYYTTLSSFKYGLKQYKKKIGSDFNKIVSENIEKSFSLVNDQEAGLAKMAESIPIVSILDSIIEHAVVLGASDIHFEPLVNEILIRYRVDGIMQEILNMPKIITPILVARVKVLANLLIDEHRVPQDGRFKFELEDINIDIRVNIMPVFHGEKVEMRLLKSSARPLTLEEVGISPTSIEIVADEIKKPHGMILVTGPTGHGKTTTLYAILHILNKPTVNITTIEDPIEYEVSRINQTQVNTKSGVTFANGLRSLLRQNPDIIMIGEIRDSETVDIAVHASLTGHLVLSSLHTNDAPGALPRLIDMGAAPFLLSSTINMVISQRLVRKICSSCIESYSITADVKKMISSQLALTGHDGKKGMPERFFRGKGCKICNLTGFHGQIGIFEVFKISEGIRDLMLKMRPVGEIRKLAIKEGMRTLFEDGFSKVEKGITTIEEVLRVIKE
ncbi:MAG: Type IV-A pilus assembly ATPase PilB [Parcubacteria group bacterium GW2011_GWB2_40_8]|nr:MAG: Type IV-A pilus assembly ATPase PilB [Parcubacteria group bacterium GW2011_GWF2_40_10]KKR47967.1 MAG: Type IV-A pilus assembly ATPase PilB [Parcubacteria group bacterium GW2011_GWA2_40_143]KKR60447.1 MAG: Type IV-A pilus assembly ATPase PilB [Parcubacteria group bacterium GW2011_GWC2_40_31]KKR74509.1 MAG: Type IV-A pilus assembly ATPase PilB [Parcubacteria group bacterium GW2011_GWB2_40_8]KKR77582.1 MAG: Type IV-A pilus assembly ATPase PilB [Parcubacteria group bacterium GW2011_GWE2_40_